MSSKDKETSTARQSAVVRARAKGLVRVLLLILALYVFLLSVNLMGTAFKLLLGEEQAQRVLTRAAADPVMALMAGILCTAIVQSSSFVTSVVVGLVASGALGPEALGIQRAVPIVMGANIGTSVTNMLVSLGHIARKDEFRRACGGAIVHDLFNLMTVAVLFPLEMATRFLSWSAQRLGDLLFGQRTVDLPNPLAWIVKPVSKALARFATDTVGLSDTVAGGILAGVALVALFLALYAIVKLLRAIMFRRLEGMFHRVLFRTASTAFLVGLLTTMLVQSSSVTTSIMVPLVAAGVVTLEQVYPYTLGANVGTTATAILASLALGSKAALVCAVTHSLFNVTGIVIFYPLRILPISLAKGLARRFAEKRHRAVLFVLAVFFGVPGAIIFVPRLLGWVGLI